MMRNIPDFDGKYKVDSNGSVYGPRGKILKPRCDKDGYLRLNMMHPRDGRKTFLVHRLMMLTYFGETPSGFCIDHIDRNKQNNSVQNLRFVTTAQNMWNSKGRTGASGFIGVAKSGSKWIARLSYDGDRITIGSFDNAIDAARARDIKAIELHGKYAALNFSYSNDWKTLKDGPHFQLPHREYPA